MMNTELIEQVLVNIRREPDKWSQQYWGRCSKDLYGVKQQTYTTAFGSRIHGVPVKTDACGTAMCVAGWAVSLAHPDSFLLISGGGDATHSLLEDGTVVDISTEARRVLGLTEHQADRLFAGSNDLEDVERILRDWNIL